MAKVPPLEVGTWCGRCCDEIPVDNITPPFQSALLTPCIVPVDTKTALDVELGNMC